MDEQRRPDPEALLKQAQAEEGSRGKLKIFLGYAAGVGKTYAMLEAAQQRRREGLDVVVGYVETHKRADTEGMLGGLEVLPRKILEYHGIQLTEMDVDAVVARRPALVLVDELAHTNAQGSRHPKRYLDVEEILDAGIDVYTTLNIQHLESLNDVVAQVTGVVVRETVPDHVIDEASEIEVIDLPPDELLTRLREGKVYIPDQAARAIQEFFRKGNLTALREMSFRRAAERVDGQMRSYMRTRAIPGVWPAGERLLVCISPSPFVEKVIRTARRMADELSADWFVVYVDVATRPELNPENRARIDAALRLAESLGAKARTIAGRSIEEAVIGYALKHNVSKIIVGKPVRPRWREMLRGSVVDRLLYASGDIDIYVISGKAEPARSVVPQDWTPHRPRQRYVLSLLLVALGTTLSIFLRGRVEPTNLVMIYLAIVVTAAVYLGRGPSLVAAIAGVLAFDYFLVPPYLTFSVTDTQYFLTFFALLAVSLIISALTAQVREQAEAAIQGEARATALYNLGRDLTSVTDLERISQIVISHLTDALGREVAIFLPEHDHVRVAASSPGYQADDNELAVAKWAYEHNQPAGRGTDTLPAASLRCVPLRTGGGLVGVLGIRPADSGTHLTSEQRQTVEAFADQTALAIERASLAERAQQADLLRAADQLQTALLNSISHDLRTPLVSITGALSALAQEHSDLDQEARSSLIQTAHEEAQRLNRLVGNLLDMTRLEAGAIQLKREACDVEDLIGTSIGQMEERLSGRRVTVRVADGTPMIPVDFVLMVHVLTNLLDNALKYSPVDSPLEVEARQEGQEVRISIVDHGMGIPEEDLDKVFGKFYRVQRPEQITGTGLGLAICKGMVEAHGGRIWAEPRNGKGTRMTIALPVEVGR
ncbi:MAG TPA: sensor histidine kinase KdpD [Anaerolineales bacterium]|nr:sensor histidine kinase KdpD [Anaerolineales bacterium]